jgi:hypothetical protein
MSDERTTIMCNTCVYLEGIDTQGNYYCAIYKRIKPRVLCIRYKGVEAFKTILEQLQKQYQELIKPKEEEK